MASTGSSGMKLEIHIEEVEQYTEKSIRTALEYIGLKAETYAKLKCPVDTGLLRNSIAHAVSGRAPRIGKSGGFYKSSYPDKQGRTHIGVYSNSKRAPTSKGDIRVYVGTNVKYAPYVEMGHIDVRSGRHISPQPFIRPALFDHIQEYEQDLISVLKEAMREELEHRRGKFSEE